MAFQHHAHSRPQVIQGRFPGGRPTIIQPKPASSQPQVAAYVQEAIHRGAPAFYRHVAQRKAIQEAGRQASTTQQSRTGNATLLPATFHFAPSIGQPMPPQVQRKMEAFFGADFSDVRVHVGPQAQQIGALAFTLGSDLYFAPGQYMPHHSHGQRLLGHELAHVVQQRAGRVRNSFGGGVAVVQDSAMEAEADRMGIQASAHRVLVQAKMSPSVVQGMRRRIPKDRGKFKSSYTDKYYDVTDTVVTLILTQSFFGHLTIGVEWYKEDIYYNTRAHYVVKKVDDENKMQRGIRLGKQFIGFATGVMQVTEKTNKSGEEMGQKYKDKTDSSFQQWKIDERKREEVLRFVRDYKISWFGYTPTGLTTSLFDRAHNCATMAVEILARAGISVTQSYINQWIPIPKQVGKEIITKDKVE